MHIYNIIDYSYRLLEKLVATSSSGWKAGKPSLSQHSFTDVFTELLAPDGSRWENTPVLQMSYDDPYSVIDLALSLAVLSSSSVQAVG